jgi:hypothetical protein
MSSLKRTCDGLGEVDDNFKGWFLVCSSEAKKT